MNKYLASLLLSTAIISSCEKEKTAEDPGYWWGHKELIKKGVSEEVVRSMGGEVAMRVAISFNDEYIPNKWVKELSLTPWRYTCEKIKKDRYYFQEEEELIKSIEKRTLKGEHIFREDLRYPENSDALSKINDKTLLIIIKKYCDFFEDPKTGRILSKMFPDGSYSDENIGVVRYDRRNFEFFSIDTRWENRFYPPRLGESTKNSVPTPSIVPYINYIGVLHTHITSKNRKPEEIAGPSSIDNYILGKENEINPYEVNAVVTYINDEEYNADIYFREIYKENGFPLNTPYVFIYDLGVFKFNKTSHK